MKGRSYGAFTLFILAMFAVPSWSQTFSVLYDFGSKSGDPRVPQFSGMIAQGRDGSLYTASYGGDLSKGAVFKITPAGVLTVLHNFKGSDGLDPLGGLTLGTDGNFYGATWGGGTSTTEGYGAGTVFKITPRGTLTVLHNFDGSDGLFSFAPPIQANDGNFYGTTKNGGPNAFGTIYKITLGGSFSVLHYFNYTDGAWPTAPLVRGTDGYLYGTTTYGGTNRVEGPGGGTIFRINTSGKLTVLHNFGVVEPFGPMIQGLDGNFYGTAYEGNKHYSVVFKMTPGGGLTVLYTFNLDNSYSDGYGTFAGLVQATDGSLYGVNSSGGALGYGTLFRLTPTGGDFSVLYDFDGTGGSYPTVTLLQHTSGMFYGDSSYGGLYPPNGVFYSLNVGLGPFVTLVPYSGKVGKTVQFLGQGFTGTTAVSFNGSSAAFTVVSDTYMTAVLPAGSTTGFVTVATPGGTLQSNKQFQVTP